MALKGFVHIRGEAAETLIIPAEGMHMQGIEEPSRILPQIAKAGGKRGLKLVFGSILPSFVCLLILSCLNYSPLLDKQPDMQMFCLF